MESTGRGSADRPDDGAVPAAEVNGAGDTPRSAPALAQQVLSAVARLSTWCLRLLFIAAAAALGWWLLAKLWVVVLPVLLALLLSTMLWPPARWLRGATPPPARHSTTCRGRLSTGPEVGSGRAASRPCAVGPVA